MASSHKGKHLLCIGREVKVANKIKKREVRFKKKKWKKRKKTKKKKTHRDRASIFGSQTPSSSSHVGFPLTAGLVAWQTVPYSGMCNRSALARLVI